MACNEMRKRHFIDKIDVKTSKRQKKKKKKKKKANCDVKPER